jgi:hypothetical protein
VVGELAIEATDFGKQVSSQRLALEVDHGGRVDASKDPGGSFGSRPTRQVPFNEKAHGGMQPANRPRAGGNEIVLSLGQQPQHRAVILKHDLS